ncbi:MAG: hypothetical protein JNL28_07235 [Planctomycetes bacterium]|nr:hypothetical protein [Planctomycetota bacterium]
MRTLLVAAFAVSLASSSTAQNINVDVGNAAVIPAATYGAAALQPGTWNPVTSLVLGSPQALLGLNGSAIPATLTLVQGTSFDGIFDNPGTSGDDQALMDDYQDGGANPIWMFSNLDPGNYTVYTYAWAPDGATFIDQVTCGTIDPPQNCGGAWPGAHTLGITYTKHRVTVPAGGSITISITIVQTYTTVNGFQIRLEDTPTTSGCLGDGTATACPCGNSGATGNGCANSTFAAGGRLSSTGLAGASAGTDTLVLTASNIPGPGLFFQSNALNPQIAFGDGHLCASSGIIRMGVVFPTGGVASYPGGLTPNPIHIAGLVNNGDIKSYQVWYRDAAVFCTPSTFNLTQTLTLQWGP